MVAPIYGFRTPENVDIRGRATDQHTGWTETEEKALKRNYHAAESKKWTILAALVSLHTMRSNAPS